MKAVRTLVLVAGDEDARFLINEGTGKGLHELAVVNIRQFADAQAEFADRPGRAGIGKGGKAMQSFDPHETVDEMHRLRFATHVIEALDKEWNAAKPDRLIVAAPPKMLGALRDKLRGPAAAALHADLPKDLVSVEVRDLARHFEKIAAF